MADRVAVIIPAYNAESTLAETLVSVLAETHPVRMIVVDDGSIDRTCQIAEQHAAQLVRQANAGLSMARNAGFDCVTDGTEFVLFLDADDVLEPDAVENLSARAKDCPDAAAVYGLVRDMHFSGELVESAPDQSWGWRRQAVEHGRLVDLPDDEPTRFNTFVIWPAVQTAGQALIRRSALERSGRWLPMPGEDWEMWLRLSRIGPFERVPRFVLRKRATPNSLSSDGKWLAAAEPYIRDWLHTLPEDEKQIARRGELAACKLRLSWCWPTLRQSGTGAGLKQAYRAGLAYARYVKRNVRR